MGDGGNGEPNGKCVPEIGCLVNGLFLDGGAWCHTNNHLVEPKNGLLFNEMATVSGAGFFVDIATMPLLLLLPLLLLYLIGLLYFNLT